MKTLLTLSIVTLLGTLAIAREQSLFNGTDLTGWDGQPGWWRVENGALTSESTAEKPCSKCNYLIWKDGTPADFELTLDFKISAEGNSGVQIRSERRPDWDTYGYQADLDGNGKLVGFVYHHERGLIAARGQKVAITEDGKKNVEQIGDPAQLLTAFKKEDWNQYRIVCNGPTIALYINGTLMCQFTDNDRKTARPDGIIALQMHPGPPMKVQFKNIILKQLKSAQAEREEALIAVLKSDAGIKEKYDACRELAQTGTGKSVPALAGLLADEKLSHMARYALETIPSPEVDTALRDTLSTLKGRPLVGVISTIGLRGDPKAAPALAGLLQNPDAEVVQQAARALGRIGTVESVNALQKALTQASAVNQPAICDALLKGAELLAANGSRSEALAVYDSLRTLAQAVPHVRAGALRGAILTRGREGLPLLMEALRSADMTTVNTGLRTALELKHADSIPMLADELEKAAPERQILLAGVLGTIGDHRGRAALLRLAKNGSPCVRPAAVKAMTEIGGAELTAPLIELIQDPDPAIEKTASDCLAGLQGAEVNSAIIKSLQTSDPKLKLKLLDMTGRRRIVEAIPVIAALMNDTDRSTRLHAIVTYEELSDTEDLKILLDRIVNNTDPDEINALARALGSACARATDKTACANQIAAAMDRAIPGVKPALIKTLKAAGGPAALKAIHAAVNNPDEQVHTAAVRTLSEWPTTDATPLLLELARKSENDSDRILSLRGYMEMARKKETLPEDRLAICRNAAPLIRRDDEKRMLLSALNGLPPDEAIKLAGPYLEDAAVKQDAASAVIAIVKQGESKARTPEAKAALEKVVTAVDNPELLKTAKTLLEQF